MARALHRRLRGEHGAAGLSPRIPKATTVNEAEFRAEWDQRVRVGRGFISPGFVTEHHEAENLRIAALKESMVTQSAERRGKLPREWGRIRPRR